MIKYTLFLTDWNKRGIFGKEDSKEKEIEKGKEIRRKGKYISSKLNLLLLYFDSKFLQATIWIN